MLLAATSRKQRSELSSSAMILPKTATNCRTLCAKLAYSGTAIACHAADEHTAPGGCNGGVLLRLPAKATIKLGFNVSNVLQRVPGQANAAPLVAEHCCLIECIRLQGSLGSDAW